MLEFRKLALIAAMLLSVSACTSMLLGGGASSGSPQATAGSLQARVYNRLRESGGYTQVQVVANGSRISLRGQVASEALRKRAESIAGSTTGVTGVDNLLVLISN